MSTTPLITCILTTRRRPQLLKRAIESVLNQTYPHLQVCVYDNASGDETAQVVSEIAKTDPRVKYFCHVENIGAINNLSYGVKNVNTPFFSHLADDDYLLPNFYATAIPVLEKNSNLMFFGGATLIMQDDKIVKIHPAKRKEKIYMSLEGFWQIIRCHIVFSSALFRTTDDIKRNGLFHPDSGIWVEWDCEFTISRKSAYYYSNEPCAVYVAHPEYSHYSHITQNWVNLNKLAGRHLTSREMTTTMKLIFFIWFLKISRGLISQLLEKEKKIDRLMEEAILTLNSYKIQYSYILLVRIFYNLLKCCPFLINFKFGKMIKRVTMR
jgi:glycosyltransferase involved in cell wall biosynthesis